MIGGLLATASSANASILSLSRINFAMGRDRLVSPALNEIHEQFGTPYRSIAVTGALIVVFIVFGDLELLATASSVLHLVVYGLLNVALIVMREAEPSGYDPEFTVPLYPITPILGAILSFALIGFIEPFVIALSALFVVLAALWYLVYARSKIENQGVLSEYVLSRAEEMPDAAVSAASTVQPDSSSEYRVMVSLANPRTEQHLITLASMLARQHGGTVHATHIVQVPDQTPLGAVSKHIDHLDSGSETLLERAERDAETFGVPVETHTIASHRSFEEVFDAARSLEADVAIMGWGGGDDWVSGRVEGTFDELAHDLPCDFLVLKDRGLDIDRVLVPTAGGPDSDLSAEVARDLRDQAGSEVALLYVIDGPEERAEGEAFLTDWAADHDLSNAEILIDESGDVESAIARAARKRTLVLIGATERGLLSRLVRGSLAYDVIDEVECSVLLAERPSKRSLREQLFGTGKD